MGALGPLLDRSGRALDRGGAVDPTLALLVLAAGTGVVLPGRTSTVPRRRASLSAAETAARAARMVFAERPSRSMSRQTHSRSPGSRFPGPSSASEILPTVRMIHFSNAHR
jgi:hypothetical protein